MPFRPGVQSTSGSSKNLIAGLLDSVRYCRRRAKEFEGLPNFHFGLAIDQTELLPLQVRGLGPEELSAAVKNSMDDLGLGVEGTTVPKPCASWLCSFQATPLRVIQFWIHLAWA